MGERYIEGDPYYGVGYFKDFGISEITTMNINSWKEDLHDRIHANTAQKEEKSRGTRNGKAFLTSIQISPLRKKAMMRLMKNTNK